MTTATLIAFPVFTDAVTEDDRPVLLQQEIHNIAAVAYQLKAACTLLYATAIVNGTSSAIRPEDATPLIECARALTDLANGEDEIAESERRNGRRKDTER